MAEMKSALELAMEKLGKIQSKESSVALTDAQRQKISELRKQYDAKIAEKEIMLQAEIRKLVQRHAPQEAAVAARQLQEQFQEAKRALLQEVEEKIAAIRTSQ
jgi:hypothetical protein